MADVSVLQRRLDQLLQQAVPELIDDYSFTFERTRTKNPADAKWVFTAVIKGRKRPLLIKSTVPARDLIKSRDKLVVVSHSREEVWVAAVPKVDGLIAQLKASPLWTPAVRKAVEKAMADHLKEQQ